MFILVAILGVIISVVMGTVWYSNSTPTGKLHMKYIGFDKLTKEEQEQKIKESMPGMWKVYSAQMILSFFTSFFISAVTYFSVQNGASDTSVFYYIPMIWLCFTVPIVGQNMLWGNIDKSIAWKKFVSDVSYNLITFMLIGVVAVILL